MISAPAADLAESYGRVTGVVALLPSVTRGGTPGSEFALSQDGFTVQLAPRAASGDDAAVFRTSGTVVESALVFTDPVNSDFSFHADILAESITIRPNTARILEA